MEESVGKTIIIEFNGLPGSGKTTISKELLSGLVSKGYKVHYMHQGISQSIRSIITEMDSLQLAWLLILYTPKCYKRTNIKQILSTIQIYRLYRDFLRMGSGVLLRDQGIIQKLISLPHLAQVKNPKNIIRIIKFLVKKGIIFRTVNVKCKSLVNVDRICKREDNGARLNQLDYHDLLSALKIQEDNLKIVLITFIQEGFFKDYYITIDSSLSPVYNAKIIIDRIIN